MALRLHAGPLGRRPEACHHVEFEVPSARVNTSTSRSRSSAADEAAAARRRLPLQPWTSSGARRVKRNARRDRVRARHRRAADRRRSADFSRARSTLRRRLSHSRPRR